MLAKKRHGLKHFENFKPLTTAGLFRFPTHNCLHTSCRPPLHSIIIKRGSTTNQRLRLVTVKTNIFLRLQESNGNFTLSTEKEEDKIRWHLNLFLNFSFFSWVKGVKYRRVVILHVDIQMLTNLSVWMRQGLFSSKSSWTRISCTLRVKKLR